MRWDPTQYARYSDERARPFLDLVARIFHDEPRRVVDLGCGPGTLTALLARRWPRATVEGIDSSPEMIERAAPAAGGPLSFRVADVSSWQPPPDADVVVSNATLQWVPGHQELLSAWAAALPAGGWLAFQVPGNFDAPSHSLMRSLAGSPRWAPVLGDVLRHQGAVAEPRAYAALLLDAGLEPDVWETTYLHLLSGPDPVLEWMRGTALRPVLAALAEADGTAVADSPSAAQFEESYAARLRAAYPASEHGTVLPFRRIFAVAHKA